jgi:hypothetical protein
MLADLLRRRSCRHDRGSILMTITYKAYIIDAFEREQDRWRATIRRQDGMRIWVAVPPSEHDSVTTSADALTAEGALRSRKTRD